MKNRNWKLSFPKTAVQTLTKVTRKTLRGFEIPTWASWAGGYFLGALAGLFPWQSAIVFGAISIVGLSASLANRLRSRRLMEFTPWELSLRDPDNDAAASVTRSNEHYLVVGQAIETIPHPQLNSRATVEQLGWKPEEVTLRDLQARFDARELLEQVGGLKEFDPPNGLKFCLIGASYITSDSPILSLDLERTDYFTIRSVLPQVKSDASIRARFGSLDPSFNKIPNSLCLHYIVRFADGEVLCMKRDARAAYHGNLWSFSGEEQLSEKDFLLSQPCDSFFKRSFCEEVLALRDEIPLDERWEFAAAIVQSMALWSIFVEERIQNSSVLGCFQLACLPEDFVALHNRLVDTGVGTRDREGDFFFVDGGDLEPLLVEGSCKARAVFRDSEVRVHAENLHPTSRYRVFRLLRAVNRGPLELGR